MKTLYNLSPSFRSSHWLSVPVANQRMFNLNNMLIAKEVIVKTLNSGGMDPDDVVFNRNTEEYQLKLNLA
jgi:hypothetical protein